MSDQFVCFLGVCVLVCNRLPQLAFVDEDEEEDTCGQGRESKGEVRALKYRKHDCFLAFESRCFRGNNQTQCGLSVWEWRTEGGCCVWWAQSEERILTLIRV